MKNLGDIDVKIPKTLLNDGRRNFTSIAAQCHVSKDVIWTHYKELKKSRVIVGATIQLNFQKLGYSGLVLILLNAESQNVEDILNRLRKIPDIGTCRYYHSKYNIAAIYRMHSLSDLDRVKQIICKQTKINEFETQIWTDVRNIPENILPDPPGTQNVENDFKEKVKKTSLKIDKIDMQIIDALTENGRLSFRKIAEQIGTTTATIARRYEKLKENNFIKVSIQINPLELGFQSILEISIALTDQSVINEIVNKLSEMTGITYLVKISGNYDLEVVALVKDCKNMIDIDNQIAKISNIKRTESRLRQLPTAWPGQRQYISTF